MQYLGSYCYRIFEYLRYEKHQFWWSSFLKSYEICEEDVDFVIAVTQDLSKIRSIFDRISEDISTMSTS